MANRLLTSFVSVLIATFLLTSVASRQVHAGKVVLVRLCVDEEERGPDSEWQAKLNRRLASASEIISKYADIQFVARDAKRWNSDNQTTGLHESLRELEKKVSADGVRLVIGFSSQHKIQVGRNHLGGTRGPLRRHILVRESTDVLSEREHLEVLVHEIGHFLCASHSADKRSAMRPVVGDGQAKSPDFRIGFDEPNAAIIRTVAQELRDRRVTDFGELSPRSLKIMRKSYQRLSRELPDDTASPEFLRAIDRVLKLSNKDRNLPPVDLDKILIPRPLPDDPDKYPAP